MKIQAIIFDKDGTLIDFDAFWVTISKAAIKETLEALQMTRIPVSEILETLGVKNGITRIDSVLCKGTYAQLGQVVYEVVKGYGCTASCEEVIQLVTDAYVRNSDKGQVIPTTPDLPRVLKELKSRGIILAVVTTDNDPVTRFCLGTLGIEELFDFLYTDDGQTPPKPDPFCANDLCRRTGISKDALLMVGDTPTDMEFAKNADISAIGIAKTEPNRQILSPHALTVIEHPAYLLDFID